MRQLVAALVMVGTLAAPVLRAVCELSCVPGAEQAAVAAPSCHEASTEPAAVNLEAPDTCRDHIQLPAVAASLKDRAGFAPHAVPLPAEFAPVPLMGASVRALDDPARGSTSPPIPPGTNILRV